MNINEVIISDPDVLNGTPVFKGTRVPVKNLFDYLEAGDSVDNFLEDFDYIPKKFVLTVLKFTEKIFLNLPFMKILLDEQLPVKLKYRFNPEIEVSTVKDENWLGIKNGYLIQMAINNGFNVFITNDQNLGFQQRLNHFKILFINIYQPSNRYKDIIYVMLTIKIWLIKNEQSSQLKLRNKII